MLAQDQGVLILSGSFTISRCLWDDAAFQDEPFSEREAWVWMIAEAKWKPQEKRVGSVVVRLDRGQLAHSTRFLADAWKWSHSKVRRFLERLENRHMIRRDSGTGVSVITICKYSEYQLSPDTNGTAAAHNPAQQRHSSGTNLNKGNKGNKYKEDTNVSLALVAPETPPDRFAEFWDQYPHRNGAKKGKAAAQKSWVRSLRNGATPDQIIGGAMRYAGDRQVIDGYAKDPATWLNQEGWKDDIEQPSRVSSAGSRPSRSGNGMVDAFAEVAAARLARDAGNRGNGGGFI